MAHPGAARSGTLISGDALSLPTSARVFSYLASGKGSYNDDRQVAESLVAHWPGIMHQVKDQPIARQLLWNLVTDHASQVVDLGCGLAGAVSVDDPMPTTLHAQNQYRHKSMAHTLYIDKDLEVLAQARAWWEWPALVAGHRVGVLDLDLTDSDWVMAALELRFDLSAPVGVVATLTLAHLDDGQFQRLAQALADRLAPGSVFALTHLSAPADVEIGAVYNERVADYGGHSQLVDRTGEQVQELLHRSGWPRFHYYADNTFSHQSGLIAAFAEKG
ncbi:SAM-dependent methyltransferase [Nocardiopsis nanhaiensis]